jgi:hypothetical protein
MLVASKASSKANVVRNVSCGMNNHVSNDSRHETAA